MNTVRKYFAVHPDKTWLIPLLLAALFWAVMVRWTAPLTELYDFRQSQTALTAYWMAKDGLNFLRPPLPVFGIEHISIGMEFPLFQAVVAILANALGSDTVHNVILAGRLLNFAAFLTAGYAFYRLVLILADRQLAIIAMTMFLFMPYPVAWGAAVMIEYAALAATLFYVEAIVRLSTKADSDWRWLLWGCIAGTIAMLVKITTVLVYGPALALLWFFWVRRRDAGTSFSKIAATTIVVGIIPLVFGVSWVLWSDADKLQSPLTTFLVSKKMSAWNYGTLQQRLDYYNWLLVVAKYWGSLIYVWVGLPLAILGIVRLWNVDRRNLLFWMLPVATGVLVFFNLYKTHAYYHVAILPGLLIVMAAGFRDVVRRQSIRHGVGLLAVFIVLSWVVLGTQGHLVSYRMPSAMLSTFRGGPTGSIYERRDRDMLAINMLRKYTKPNDVVMISESDWSSMIPLMSERRVLMVLHECRTDLRSRPHLDYYFIDTKLPYCGDMTIPDKCRIAATDGAILGNCLQPREQI